MGPEKFEAMSGRAEDFTNLKRAIAPLNARIADRSENTTIFAIQGPNADKVLFGLGCDTGIEDIPYFCFREVNFMRQSYRLGRLGFTGLNGVEILCPLELAPSLWEGLSSKITPAGIIAGDRIRINAGLALFTQEFLPDVTAANA